jgi:hypothetical protein
VRKNKPNWGIKPKAYINLKLQTPGFIKKPGVFGTEGKGSEEGNNVLTS